MGREAYLSRVVLGRSAFDEPLRDENGNLVLGGQARAFDDQSYVQQFDDRGHPQNLESERRAKRFRKAQNEVLAACGVVVRRDEDRRRTHDQTDSTEAAQLTTLQDENKTGLLFKCADRLAGDVLTWWISSLRKRLMVFGAFRPSMTESISRSFSQGRVPFLFSGFSAWVAAEIPRIARRTEITEPVECMNYLDFDLGRTAPSWHERLWDWIEAGVWLSIELPLEFTSSLQSLGFVVLPAIWTTLGEISFRHSTTTWLFNSPLTHQLAITTALYLLRDHLQRQMGWRIYGLLRQILPRPHHPTELSIQALNDDDFVDDTSIVGIGRSLGPGTDRRYYGPQDFWTVLPVAFPWLSIILRKRANKEEIKNETLMRCAMMEHNEGVDRMSRSQQRDRRARNIIGNLESLGVDIEEDFYVDIDQWSLQIDSWALEYEEEDEEAVMRMPSARSWQQEITTREDFLIAAQEYRAISHGSIIGQRQGQDEEATAGIEGSQPPTNHEEAPATPEPGIRRATSLSTTTPRPVRRPTETNGPDFDEEMEALLAEARRETTSRKKAKAKDDRQYRITRLTTYAVDSLAWHSSAIITNLVMLPIDAIYYRSLASWFFSVTGSAGGSPVLPVGDWSGGSSHAGTTRWQYHRMLLLSLGLECLVRGAIWQVGHRVVLSYGRWFSWEKF